MEQTKENKMGTMPIGKLIVSMSLPIMISMLVQALYNIVDSVYVARFSEEALTAVSMAFPVQMLTIAVGVGTGVGINALLSRSLGEKNFEQANQAATNGLFVILLSYIVFALVGLLGAEPFFALQTEKLRMTDPEKATQIMEQGSAYLKICMVLSFGCLFQMTMERLLQSTGRTMYTMITQGTGAVINIIMDPILIFGLLGAPRMGAAGAAIATVFGQIVAMGLAIYFNIKKNTEIHISFRKFRPNGAIIRNIYWVGIPSIVMQSIGSIMTYGMNQIIMPFSYTAVSVFGVYFKLNSFIFMPVFGLNNGLIPIIAYNYGARKKERIMSAFKMGVKISILIMFIGVVIFQVFPKQLLQLFDASPTMLEIGIPALRIISVSFLFAGFCIVVTSVLQAFGDGFLSLVVSAVRQLVIILPVAWIFAHTIGLQAVWWALPIAEVFSVGLSILFFSQLYQKRIKRLDL